MEKFTVEGQKGNRISKELKQLLVTCGFEVKDSTTQASVQTLLRDVYQMNVYIGFRPNQKNWQGKAASMKLDGYEYVRKYPIGSNRTIQIRDTYEEALNDGLIQGLKELVQEQLEQSSNRLASNSTYGMKDIYFED